MKTLYLLAASGLALTTAACAPKTTPVRAALECPQTQGDLSRTAVASDGKSCTYVTSNGAEVTLQLISTASGADAALSAVETTLLANRQAPKADEPAKAADGKPAADTDKALETKIESQINDEIEKAVGEAKQDTQSAGVTVRIDKTGKQVSETGDGKTRVDLPGIHIVADDANDSANVRVGPITINAGDGGATIRIRRDVRLRGEALNPEKRGLRATFIYTGEDLPSGYRFVGYEAGGPKAGPITVAIVKSKMEGDDGGEIYPDVKKLVRKNGGV